MMNNRGHLPAGQGMHGGPEVASGPGGGGGGGGAGAGVGGGGGGPRRGGGRSQPHHPNAYYHNQHAAHMNQMSHQMYPNPYMAPYGAPPYYPVPQQYQAGGMPPAPYMPMAYPPPAAYSRSPPPPMQQYVPMTPQAYGRPPQHSPVVSSPYQAPPPAPIPALPHHAPFAAEPYPPPAMKALTPQMREAPLVHSQPPPPLTTTHSLQEPTPVANPEQSEPAVQPPAPASVHTSTPGSLPALPTEVVPTVQAEVQPPLAVPPTMEPFRPPVSCICLPSRIGACPLTISCPAPLVLSSSSPLSCQKREVEEETSDTREQR